MATLLAVGEYWWSWADLLVRWLHVIAAIAWIGTSFYFIALDDHLRAPAEPRDGIGGESWEIHGGGFYRVDKYAVAPATLPDPLHWFKWEAYTTWLSGLALFLVVYYLHASTFLVDRSVADLTGGEAIAISLAGLALAWLVYDGLCRVLGRDDRALAVAVLASLTLAAWGAGRLFSGRASYVEVGAMIGTMMAGNVFFVIMPAQRELVRAKRERREPDPRHNARGKQRSVHNNYLTLPVVFAMLSNHFPFTYGHRHAWLILVVLLVLGAWTRHFFNLRHRGRNAWWILVTAAAGVAVLAVLIRPSTPVLHAAGAAPPFARVQAIVQERCAPCHSLHPTQPGYPAAPLGIRFDTRAEIETQAGLIAQLAVQTQTMPPGNVTHMTPAERAALARWLASR